MFRPINRLAGLAVAAALTVTALAFVGTAPVAAGGGTLNLSTTSPAVGQAVTASLSGFTAPADTYFCYWTVVFPQAGVSSGISSGAQTLVDRRVNESRTCDPYTFVLTSFERVGLIQNISPYPQNLTPTITVMATVMDSVVGGGGTIFQSSKTATYTSWTGSATPTANLSSIAITVDNTHPALGDSDAVTITPLGPACAWTAELVVAAEYRSVDGSAHWGAQSTFAPDSPVRFTFTESAAMVTIEAELQCFDSSLQRYAWTADTMLRVPDPAQWAEDPAATDPPAPTEPPVATSAPTSNPTVAPTDAPANAPTLAPTAAPVYTLAPTSAATGGDSNDQFP